MTVYIYDKSAGKVVPKPPVTPELCLVVEQMPLPWRSGELMELLAPREQDDRLLWGWPSPMRNHSLLGGELQ